MKKLYIVFILIAMLLVWLNTYNLSYDYIREHDWKNYKDLSYIFKDVIAFKSSNRPYSVISLKDDGRIYKNDTIYLGHIYKKHHNYVNSYIIVVDTNKVTTTYITKNMFK